MDSHIEAHTPGADLMVVAGVHLPTSTPPSPKGLSSRAISPLEKPLPYLRGVGSVPYVDKVCDQLQDVHGSSEPFDAQILAASSTNRDLYAPPRSPWLVEGTPPALQTTTEPNTFASENLEKPQFTEGPCKLGVVNDGEKDCFAVLLTRAMITQLENMCSIVAEVETLNKDHAISTARAYQEGIHVQRLLESTDDTKGAIIQIKKRRELEDAQLEYNRLSNERDLFGQYLNDEKQKLFACQETILSSMRTTLTEGGLLNDDEGSEKAKNGGDLEEKTADSISENYGGDVHRYDQVLVDRQKDSLGTPWIILRKDDNYSKHDESKAKPSSYNLEKCLAGTDSWDVAMDALMGAPPPVQSNDVFPSQEVLQRRAIDDKCINTELHLNRLGQELEAGWWIYDRELIEFQKAVEEENCSTTQSEFDRHYLMYRRALTKKILEAEDEQNKALSEQMALSIADDDIKQDMALEEGVLETFGHGNWRVHIEAWLNGVSGGKEHEAAEFSLDDTTWKVRTVAFVESQCCMEKEAVCAKKIKQYREQCEKLRKGSLLQWMLSDGGAPVSGDANE